MGRPWWYDSYWEKKEGKRRAKGFKPGGPLLSWLMLLIIALLLTLWRTFR